MIDAGADLVLGHGPHVVRPMEMYRDRLIAYSLGNFATYYGISVEGIRGIAPILLATLDDEGRFVRAGIEPTIQIRPPVPLRPGGQGRHQPAAVADDRGISRRRSRCCRSRGRRGRLSLGTRDSAMSGARPGGPAAAPQAYSESSVMLRKSTPSERSLRYRCVRSMPTRLASWPTLPLHSSSCCCR